MDRRKGFGPSLERLGPDNKPPPAQRNPPLETPLARVPDPQSRSRSRLFAFPRLGEVHYQPRRAAQDLKMSGIKVELT